MSWEVDKGEEARLTPEGPTAAAIFSRGALPLRVRSTLGSAAFGRQHPGTAVQLGKQTFEVVSEESAGGCVVYRLEPWPRDQPIRDRVSYGPRLVRATQEQRRRELRAHLAGPLAFGLSVLVALLPAPERQAIAQRLSLDVLRGTLLAAAIQVLAAGILWPVGLVKFFHDRQAAVAGQITREQREITEKDMAEAILYSRLGVLMYLVTPKSLGLLYVGFTGFARFLSVQVSAQPLGDPVLALLLGALRAGRRRQEREARLAELGPERPDRVLEDADDLVVISAREKTEWSPRATIQVGERFYRVRHVDERADGRWRAIAYRLTPLEKGNVIRGLVHYAPPQPRPRAAQEARSAEPASSHPPAPVASQGEAPVETAQPASAEKPSSREIPGLDSSKTRWRFDAGEEARLTPDGPCAAVIESLGSLPLRPRSQAMGVHHRPEFPGTCVTLGGARFEVIDEQPLDTGFRYLLDPWPRESIFRDALEYGPKLVRAAQRERERAVFREQAAAYSKWLSPLIGLLPESRQVILCERYGLDAADTTLAGAVFECLMGGILLGTLSATVPVLFFPLAPWVVLGVFFPGIGRGFAALVWGEVGGSAMLGAAFNLSQEWKHVTQRFDPMVLPLTREAFWARLGLPDRQERAPDGTLVVRSVLAHLTWAPSFASRAAGRPPMIQAGPDHWNVASLPPVIERGRLTYVYQLWSAREAGMRSDLPDPRPPDPRQYQQDVLEGVAREWDDIFSVAPWVPALLPAEAQERAYRQRGGAAAARRWTAVTAGVELLLAVWFFGGRGAFNVLTGALLLLEAGSRLWRTLDGRFAPSFLGSLFSDYLRPERVAYHAHRDAERETLAALRSGS
jgi:hypothetical protein